MYEEQAQRLMLELRGKGFHIEEGQHTHVSNQYNTV